MGREKFFDYLMSKATTSGRLEVEEGKSGRCFRCAGEIRGDLYRVIDAGSEEGVIDAFSFDEGCYFKMLENYMSRRYGAYSFKPL